MWKWQSTSYEPVPTEPPKVPEPKPVVVESKQKMSEREILALSLPYIYSVYYTYVLGTLICFGPPQTGPIRDFLYRLLPAVLAAVDGTALWEVYRTTKGKARTGALAVVLVNVLILTSMTLGNPDALKALLVITPMAAFFLGAAAWSSPYPAFKYVYIAFATSVLTVVIWRFIA